MSIPVNTKTQVTQPVSLPKGTYLFCGRTSIVSPAHFMVLCMDDISTESYLRLNANDMFGCITINEAHNFFMAIATGSNQLSITTDANLTSLIFIKLK